MSLVSKDKLLTSSALRSFAASGSVADSMAFRIVAVMNASRGGLLPPCGLKFGLTSSGSPSDRLLSLSSFLQLNFTQHRAAPSILPVASAIEPLPLWQGTTAGQENRAWSAANWPGMSCIRFYQHQDKGEGSLGSVVGRAGLHVSDAARLLLLNHEGVTDDHVAALPVQSLDLAASEGGFRMFLGMQSSQVCLVCLKGDTYTSERHVSFGNKELHWLFIL